MGKQIRIFHKPHRNQLRENEFAEFLADRLSGTLVNERFTLDPKALDCVIDTRALLACLNADCCLPTAKRQECIELVKEFDSA